MKIAIMTWFHYHNYGTALQVVALNEYLRSIGHAPFVINYRPSALPILAPKGSTISYVAKKIHKRVGELVNSSYTTEKREEKFESFLFDHLIFTEECKTLSDLERLNNEYDAFICGSDQIWSPILFNPHYYLDFINDQKKMIAFAPSVGLSQISDINVKARVKELVDRFTYLSTREYSGSTILSNLIGRDVKTVLDPSFLVDKQKWSDCAKSPISNSRPYLLVYMLGKNEKHWRQIFRIAERLQLKVLIIPTFSKDLKRQGCIKDAVGVQDFLALVKNASYVCTDSFHGTVFSIIFNKQFSVFERFKEKDEANQNSRIYHILKLLGLESRLLTGKDYHSIQEGIDYNQVNRRLDEEKEKTESFLKAALSGVAKHEYNAPKNDNVQTYSSLCCGCGACEAECPAGAIQIRMSKEGFYQAFIDGNCVSCRKCIDVCPFVNKEKGRVITDSKLYSYIDRDKEVLSCSSSGGAGYRIAKYGLEKDYQILGCIFDEENHHARHIVIQPSESDSLHLIQGSKYIQSAFAPVLSSVKGKTIIFGTPCQIAGAHSLYKNRQDVILVDLICHGVPTYYLYEAYLRYLHDNKRLNTNNPIKTVFRVKRKGWRTKHIWTSDNRNSYSSSQNQDLFLLPFDHSACYMRSCYECPWRDSSLADLRLGDYWHSKYASNHTGVSMIASFTKKGEDVIHFLQNNQLGIVKEEPTKDYYACQQTQNLPRPVFWEDFLQDLSSGRNLNDIVKQYVIPLHKRSALMRRIVNIWKVVNRNGRSK